MLHDGFQRKVKTNKDAGTVPAKKCRDGGIDLFCCFGSITRYFINPLNLLIMNRRELDEKD